MQRATSPAANSAAAARSIRPATPPLAALAVVAALGLVVFLSGCVPHSPGFNSPTGPGNSTPTVDSFRLSATVTDTDGAPHIIEAVLDLDRNQIGDSCPPSEQVPQFDPDGTPTGDECEAPASAAATFNVGGGINPGSHTLQVAVITQSGLGPYPYGVKAFSVMIYDANGKLIQTLPLNPQSKLGVDPQFTYNFSF